MYSYFFDQLTGIIGGIELPFDGCPVNACENLSTGACPVAAGDTIVYDLAIPVSPPTGCSLNIVVFSKNSRKFATSSSPALGCY